jgi:hypothetical protein
MATQTTPLYQPTWAPRSTFVPAKRCSHCQEPVSKLVAPDHWPVDMIMTVCYACGRTKGYVDNLLLMSPREAVIEFQSRPFAVRRGVAIQPSSYEVAREMILLALEGGLSPIDVAAELNIERNYVLNIARAAGIDV